MHDIIVINAFHRGDWFIDQLKALGKNVQTFDWSEKMGERSDAEMLGPFGLFGEEKINPELRQWIDKNYEKTLQTAGWSLWSDFGTFEAQGPFRVPQYFQNEEWIEAVFKNFLSKIDWPRKKWNEMERQFNPIHDYWTLSSVGPKVRGISLQSTDHVQLKATREKKSIFVNDKEWSAPFFVFFLNSYEMAPFFDEGLAALIRGDVLRPRMCWQMLQMQIDSTLNLQKMPARTLLIEHGEDPWSEQNFLILNKTKKPALFEVWYRSYFDFHHREDYFQKIEEKVIKIINKKLKATSSLIVQKPRELLSPNFQSLFPIYDPQAWETQSSWYADGLFFVGPEKVNDFLFSTYWALQNLIVQSLREGKSNG